jgi:hypothetical protein
MGAIMEQFERELAASVKASDAVRAAAKPE